MLVGYIGQPVNVTFSDSFFQFMVQFKLVFVLILGLLSPLLLIDNLSFCQTQCNLQYMVWPP